jgi:hypothetical protein
VSFSKTGPFAKRDATLLIIFPNPAFAGGSESETLVIRKNAFVGTSIPAIVVDIVKHLFQVYMTRRFEDWGPAHFHEVALWGFNVGRQDCEIYMNVLFKLNREKLRNGSVITAFRNATTAVVGVAGSSPSTTLSILSASFRLLSALNDAYFTTYLFSEVPGLVAKKVAEQQETYLASLKPGDIQTPADAYHAIRGYYAICLPETIEGTLLQQVAGGTTKSDPPPKTPTGGAAGGPATAARAGMPAGPRNSTPARINTIGAGQ